jgi:CheY-like chemotaxis protein
MLQHYPPGTTLHFGAPVRCPDCGDFAMVTEVDRVQRRTSYYCSICRLEWGLSAAALRSAKDLPSQVVSNLGELAGSGTGTVTVNAGENLRVLLVEDDPADVELIKAILAPSSASIEVAHATSRSLGQEIARRGDVDLVMLDLGLPDSSGLSTLTSWQALTPPRPVVVLSGDSSPGVVAGAKEIGAAQFVHKSELVPLVDRGAEGTAALVDFLRSIASTRSSVDSSTTRFGVGF